MLHYPIHIAPDGDGFLITCPDLPEVTTDADHLDEAHARAADAIDEAIAGRLDDFEDIPRPSGGQTFASPSSLLSMKVLLFWTMQDNGLSRADLVRLLGWKRTQVERLFHPRHSTRIDQFDAAFSAMGVRLDMSVEPAEAA